MRLSSMALQSDGLGCSNIHNHFGAGSDCLGPTTGAFGKGPYFPGNGQAKIRRTEVRPIRNRRAISALLTPSR